MSVLKNRIGFPKCFITRKTAPAIISTEPQHMGASNSVDYFLSQEEINFYSENGYLVIRQLFETRTLDNLRVSSDGATQYPLNQEQLISYWDKGFIVIKKLFDRDTLNMFRSRFVEIANMSDGSRFYSIVKDPALRQPNLNPEMYINKIQDILYDDVFCKYSEDPRMLHIVSQLIGDHLTAYNCMLINKPPGSQRHPPHQDMYYFPIRPADKVTAAWTAIDPVYVDNGSLYVVPGSHKVETLYIHEDKAADKKQFFQGIKSEDIVAPHEKRVYLEMAPGDTVFFHPYLIHGSGANESQVYRKIITAHYANSSCHYIDVRGTPQEVLARVIEDEIKRRGGTFGFAELWRIKSKQVKGVRSNL